MSNVDKEKIKKFIEETGESLEEREAMVERATQDSIPLRHMMMNMGWDVNRSVHAIIALLAAVSVCEEHEALTTDEVLEMFVDNLRVFHKLMKEIVRASEELDKRQAQNTEEP